MRVADGKLVTGTYTNDCTFCIKWRPMCLLQCRKHPECVN